MTATGNKITVTVPAYNEASNIGYLLQSLIDQGGMDEIIVVDDLSTDSTRDIVRSFGPRVRLIVHEERAGQTAAWRTALRHASNEIVVFSDADSIPARRSIEILASAIEAGAYLAGGIAKPRTNAWPPARFSALILNELGKLGRPENQIIGRLFALRRSWLRNRDIPPNVIANDLWLLRAAQADKKPFVYCPDAETFYTAPSTVRDFKSQTIRAAAGREQLRSWGFGANRPLDIGMLARAFFSSATEDPIAAIAWIAIHVLVRCCPWPYAPATAGGIWEAQPSTKGHNFGG